MPVKLLSVLSLLAAAATGVGILAAPVAAANQCTTTSPGTTICQRPGGSTAINTSPTQVGPYLGFDCYLDYLDPLCDNNNSGITIGGPGFIWRPGRR
jgi:hypothetical protein